MKSLKKLVVAGAISLIPFIANAQENEYSLFEPYIKKEIIKTTTIDRHLDPEGTDVYNFLKKPKIDEEIKIPEKNFFIQKLFGPSKIVTDRISHLIDFYFIGDVPNPTLQSNTTKDILIYGSLANIEPHYPKDERQERTADMIRDYVEDDFVDRAEGMVKIRTKEFSAFGDKKSHLLKKHGENPARENLSLDFKFKKDNFVFDESISVRTRLFKIKSPIKSLKLKLTIDDNLKEVVDVLFYKRALTRSEIQQYLAIEQELHEMYFSEVLGWVPTNTKGWMLRSTFRDNHLSNALGYKYKKYFGEFGFAKNDKSFESFFLNLGKQRTAVKLRYKNTGNKEAGIEFSKKEGNKVYHVDFDCPFNSKNKKFFAGTRIYF